MVNKTRTGKCPADLVSQGSWMGSVLTSGQRSIGYGVRGRGGNGDRELGRRKFESLLRKYLNMFKSCQERHSGKGEVGEPGESSMLKVGPRCQEAVGHGTQGLRRVWILTAGEAPLLSHRWEGRKECVCLGGCIWGWCNHSRWRSF